MSQKNSRAKSWEEATKPFREAAKKSGFREENLENLVSKNRRKNCNIKKKCDMEFLDVVNKKDEVVGKASKKDIYEKTLTHRIVHILIFNKEGEMALQLRSKSKDFTPSHWCTAAGGHVKSGETYEQAALRECEEELGIKLDMNFLYKDLYTDFPRKGLKKFLGIFKATYEGPFEINPEEVEKIEFFNLEEIQKMVDKKEKLHPELLVLLEKHFGIKLS